MPPPNGSDSERLMAEIEAYLRTGEGPPPAPEPAGDRPREPEGMSLDHQQAPRRIPAGRIRRLRRRATTRLQRTQVWIRMDAAGRRGREWSGGALHPSGGHPSQRSRSSSGRGNRGSGASSGRGSGRGIERGTSAPPRWTPARVVTTVVVLVGLLLVPVVWKKSSGGGAGDGTDHASAAPAAPGYSFLQVNRSGTPVRWNPCTPIAYQLDLAAAPPWAQTDIGDAISSISTATGIPFVYDGSTNQFPTGDVPAGSSAQEPAPVVIAWASADQSRQLNLPVSASGASASGGSASGGSAPGGSAPGGSAPGGSAPGGYASGSAAPPAVESLGRTVPLAAQDQPAGHSVYVSGSVVISSFASDLPEGFGPGGAGVLVLHQLGRLVGLGDVRDPAQVMNSDVLATQVTALGSGDRAGLQRLGRESGCLKVPANAAIEPVL